MSGWPTVRLDMCCEIISGATPSTSNAAFWDGDINWATPKDLADLDGPRIASTPRKITEAGLKSCAASVLPVGSVLFSSRAPIGHVAINDVPMATNQGFKSFVPRHDRMHAGYLYHWLRCNRRYLESLGNGATFKEVSKAVVARIEIPLPPLPEQRRIAAILDEADALRAKRRAALAQLDEMTQAIFGEMFGDPIENPRQLPVVQLSSVIASDRPITYGILKPGPDIPDGVPYVRVVDMAAGQVRLEGIRRTSSSIAHEYRRSTLRSGDLLISIRGHVGRVAVTPSDLDGANITQDTARLAVVGACPIYLQGILESPPMREWMDRRTKGAAVQGINLGDLKQMPILLPPPEEQLAFANRVSELRVIADRAAAQVGAFDSLFSSLQHRAFRGEL